MWDIREIRNGEEGKLLEEGWEPFGVSPRNTSYEFHNTSLNKREIHHQTTDYIYLRRELAPVEVEDKRRRRRSVR